MTSISIAELFKGHEDVLAKCLQDIAGERSGPCIAKDHLEAILGDLEANAGAPMDATYIAYMLIFSAQNKLRNMAALN